MANLAVEVPDWALSAAIGLLGVGIVAIISTILRLSSKVAVLEDKVSRLDVSSHDQDVKLDALTASVAAMSNDLNRQLAKIEALLTVQHPRPSS